MSDTLFSVQHCQLYHTVADEPIELFAALQTREPFFYTAKAYNSFEAQKALENFNLDTSLPWFVQCDESNKSMRALLHCLQPNTLQYVTHFLEKSILTSLPAVWICIDKEALAAVTVNKKIENSLSFKQIETPIAELCKQLEKNPPDTLLSIAADPNDYHHLTRKLQCEKCYLPHLLPLSSEVLFLLALAYCIGENTLFPDISRKTILQLSSTLLEIT
jgi:hypothetical protein